MRGPSRTHVGLRASITYVHPPLRAPMSAMHVQTLLIRKPHVRAPIYVHPEFTPLLMYLLPDAGVILSTQI